MLKADLHIHTRYSMDCQMPLEKILKRCQQLGINCIAIADHGTAEGALEMQKIAPFKVIVAEEILTTQGEIMGMFLKETIPSGITPQEAVKRIREQGGLVNIPHPFETMRGSALKDQAIEEIVKDIDLMEVLNSRSPFPANTNKAKAFAEKHNIPGGAGSDAHTLFEIGNAYIEIPDFNTKEEFLEAIAGGKICGKRSGAFVHLFSGWAKIKGKLLRKIKLAKSYRIGWFSTGRGAGSKGMLKATQEAIKDGDLKAVIEFVFCSRERGETEPTDQYLDMIKQYRIPLVNYSYQNYRKSGNLPNPDRNAPLPQWRIDYDKEVLRRLKKFHPDLVVLAGFMLITTPLMCEKYKIINLHPAAPGGPAGTWQQVIWKLIDTKADTQGIKMHVAIPELDMGPTATYCTFSIRGEPFDKLWKEIEGKTVVDIKASEGENNALFKKIREYGALREVPLIIATLKAFSEGRIKITKDRRVVDVAGRLIEGYDLTGEIDEAVKDKL